MENHMLTAIMYHYVRDLPNTHYPGIKGLLTKNFEGQLDYIMKHYKVCSLKQVHNFLQNKETLPPNPCVLTFDDGFIDHYLTVFPLLANRGLTGSFYPVAETIEKNIILDVHKIHFILASINKPENLVKEIFELLKPHRKTFDLPDDDTLYKMNTDKSRFDPPDIIFIKRILQRALPQDLRSKITNELFIRYVTPNQKAFAKELYMDIKQLQLMHKSGMEICGHGYKHNWLGCLSIEEQQKEIDHTVNFLTKIYGAKPSEWVMAYPYGSYNTDTTNLLKKAGCVLALTSQVDIDDLSKPLEIKRLDTNDLPFSADVSISKWTQKIKKCYTKNN